MAKLVHRRNWASAGLVTQTRLNKGLCRSDNGKPLWQDSTQPLLDQYRADCGKPLRQDGTQPVLAQCWAGRHKPLRQDGTQPVLVQRQADCEKPLRQDGTQPLLAQCRADCGNNNNLLFRGVREGVFSLNSGRKGMVGADSIRFLDTPDFRGGVLSTTNL